MKLLDQNRVLGGAFVLAITQFGASVMGLIRDRTLAGTFSGLNVVDVYIAAFRPSDLLFQATVMAGFSVALVPLLSGYHAKGDREEMGRLLSSILLVFAVAFGVLAFILGVFFPWIAPYFVRFTGKSLHLYIQFGRIALLTNFLFVFGNAFGQYLVTIQRYWIYGITPILYTLGTILGTMYLTPMYGPYGPILGTLGGAIVYVILRFIGVAGSYRLKVQNYRLCHPDLSEFFRLMAPKMLAFGALQIELLFFDTIASGLDAGSITINAYARNFQSVVVGVIGIALAQSIFSHLSQAAAQKDMRRFSYIFCKGFLFLIILTVPSTLALILLSPVAASLVHLTHVLHVFSLSLFLYALSIPFESINHLFLRSFYALRETRWPAVFNVVNGAIAVFIGWFFAPIAGVYSLALGYTVGQVVQTVGFGVLLKIRTR